MKLTCFNCYSCHMEIWVSLATLLSELFSSAMCLSNITPYLPFCDVEEQVRGKYKGFQREFMKPLMILFVLSSQDLHLLMYSSLST